MNNNIKIGIASLVCLGVGFVAGDIRRGLMYKRFKATHEPKRDIVFMAMEEIPMDAGAGLSREEFIADLNEQIRFQNLIIDQKVHDEDYKWGEQ